MDPVITSPDPPTAKVSLPWAWRPVKRRMLPGCELFREGDAAMHVARKLIPLENDDSKAKASEEDATKETIPCNVVGCTQTFSSLLSYENHYKSVHRHACLTCHRTFPSNFLLDLHIQESHDPLFAVLASRQPMYRCLVESCGDKFCGADDRRQHMVTVHSYPANFRFHSLRPSNRKKAAPSNATVPGNMDIDPHPSSHRQKDDPTDAAPDTGTPPASHSNPGACPSQSSGSEGNGGRTGADASQGRSEGGGEDGMEVVGEGEAEKQVPRRVFVHKVPQNISFGHGAVRGFQRPPGKKKGKKKGGHWHQRTGGDDSAETTVNIENVDMKEMADALSGTV